MRSFLFASTLLAALVIPVTAQADTVDFTFTPTGGTAVTFTLTPSDITSTYSGIGVLYDPVTFSDNSTHTVAFTVPAAYVKDYGPVNFILDPNTSDQILFDGVQLYSGSESDPIFTSDSFALDPNAPGSASGTLLIDDISNASPVPEPSSLVLLATGLLGSTAAFRRRLR